MLLTVSTYAAVRSLEKVLMPTRACPGLPATQVDCCPPLPPPPPPTMGENVIPTSGMLICRQRSRGYCYGRQGLLSHTHWLTICASWPLPHMLVAVSFSKLKLLLDVMYNARAWILISS